MVLSFQTNGSQFRIIWNIICIADRYFFGGDEKEQEHFLIFVGWEIIPWVEKNITYDFGYSMRFPWPEESTEYQEQRGAGFAIVRVAFHYSNK